jgi:hypothetical protein
LEFLRRAYNYHPLSVLGDIHVDEIRNAGGAKDLVEGESYLLNQVLTSLKLHHAPEVLLFLHQNCGAYGQLSLPEGQTEQEYLASQLMTARDHLQKFLAENGHRPRIRMFICGFEGIFEVTSD